MGWWTTGPNARVFDNAYYTSLMAKGWEPVNVAPGKNQWIRGDGGTRTGDPNIKAAWRCWLPAAGGSRVAHRDGRGGPSLVACFADRVLCSSRALLIACRP